ncbi:aminotransferase class V-fold PLP-dependent enzyme [Candidatus Riflebacteria bacterium]
MTARLPSPDFMRKQFLLDESVTFLNHGSFGACPKEVFSVYQEWQYRLERQPVAFFREELLPGLQQVQNHLATFFNCREGTVIPVTNATFGVNLVAQSLKKGKKDEIVVTDHEYGACLNAWHHWTKKAGLRLKVIALPIPLENSEELFHRIFTEVSDKTALIFFSHITSSTAQLLPVREICLRAREKGILTMVDGAHAPGQIADLDLDAVAADFYTGNCHKWLFTPKGSAIFYAREEVQAIVEPLVVSWGHGPESAFRTGDSFVDRILFSGTRDPAAYLTIPAGIEFYQRYHIKEQARRCHQMLARFLRMINEGFDRPAMYPDDSCFKQMGVVSLPFDCSAEELKTYLYSEYRIEIPVFRFAEHLLLRPSAQVYNSEENYYKLIDALKAFSVVS